MGAQAWNDSLIKRLQVIFTLACRLSSLLAAWDVSPEETSAPLRQKFRIAEVINVHIMNPVVMGFQMQICSILCFSWSMLVKFCVYLRTNSSN